MYIQRQDTVELAQLGGLGGLAPKFFPYLTLGTKMVQNY